MALIGDCKELQAINRTAREVAQGLAYAGGDPISETANRIDQRQAQDNHKLTCSVCSPERVSTKKCNFVDTTVSKYLEVTTGLLMAYGDTKEADTQRQSTLDKIRLHIDDCLTCRAAFRKHIGKFIR